MHECAESVCCGTIKASKTCVTSLVNVEAVRE